MTETQQLLGKITALRQRLDQAQGLASEAGNAVSELVGHEGASLVDLRHRAAEGSAHDRAVDQATLANHPDREVPVPRQLTARARLLAERGRELLTRLRGLNDALAPDVPESRTSARAVVYRQTLAITTTALRALAFLPDTVTAQLPLCDGPAALLDVVAARLHTLEATVQREGDERNRVELLALWLKRVEQGQAEDLEPFVLIANELVAQAEECLPLRFLPEDATGHVATFVATHALNVASVVARVARHLPSMRYRTIEPVLAALLMDVGMLRIPSESLASRAEWNDEQHRTLERHSGDGEELVRPLEPDATWLARSVLQHHERLDGTGYPEGVREHQIDPISRLLAVCDVYVSLASQRPHRGACDPRTAMTETLLMADQGLLDRDMAEALLQLSFYPVGTLVEMADGAVGVVAAVPARSGELTNPSRPVVLVLLESGDVPLAIPRHLDLAQVEGHSIVRSLTPTERRQRIGRHFPEWA